MIQCPRRRHSVDVFGTLARPRANRPRRAVSVGINDTIIKWFQIEIRRNYGAEEIFAGGPSVMRRYSNAAPWQCSATAMPRNGPAAIVQRRRPSARSVSASLLRIAWYVPRSVTAPPRHRSRVCTKARLGDSPLPPPWGPRAATAGALRRRARRARELAPIPGTDAGRDLAAKAGCIPPCTCDTFAVLLRCICNGCAPPPPHGGKGGASPRGVRRRHGPASS